MAKGDDSPHQPKKKRTDDDSLPPDAGQKPIQLQRRRVWRACESCRRKKIKCDGCEPTCSQCTASGSQCTWLQTKDRAALSRHYVQELEARLLHMESLFTQITPLLEQVSSGVPNGQPASSSSPPINPDLREPAAAILRSMSSPPKEQSAEPSTPIKVEDEVSDSFGQLALDEYGHMRWMGGSSTMSLIQSFREVTASPLYRISPAEEDPLSPAPSVSKLYFPASVFFGKTQALPGPEEVEYPPRDLADKLIDAYFTKFHFLLPVIDRPSFIQTYKNLMDNRNNARLAQSETPNLSLLFAVFACAANLIDDPRVRASERLDEGGMGMIYYERALILQYISHANIQPAHVQCFILLSSFLCSVNCLPQAWILLGQAVRTGQDLGLHRSPRRLTITPVEKETRRKIWWGVYTLDRMLALALGRPLGINDADCDVELPVDVEDEQLPEYFDGANYPNQSPALMGGFVALIKLYEIGGRVLRQVYGLESTKENLEPDRKAELLRLVESLDGELGKWQEDLPACFQSQSQTAEQSSMAVVLGSHYYSILTTLHRNFLPIKKDQPVTSKSTQQGVSAARSLIHLAVQINGAVPLSHHLAFYIQHLFSSAVILLLYAMHSVDPRAASSAMEEAKGTVAAIEVWEGKWPGARKCKELLVDLINTTSQAMSPSSGNNSIPMSPPASAAPALLERRRSASISAPGRAVKPRSRRNQSRDPGGAGSGRRMAAVSPYRVDNASRARSTSRKRGHDETEVKDHNNVQFYQSFPSPTSARQPTSNHSSPASGGTIPSPPPTTQDQFDSPSLAAASPFTGTFGGSPTMAPSIASPQRFEFGMQASTLPSQSQWNGAGPSEQSNFDVFNTDGTMSYPYGYSSSQEIFYPSYEPSTDFGLSTTPPTASFAATGLPFRGLDLIRNYNNNGYSGGYSIHEQDSLWQSYDPVAFDYPEVPFTLGDPGGTEMLHEHSQ